jgi:hypothetical protein
MAKVLVDFVDRIGGTSKIMLALIPRFQILLNMEAL